LAENPLSRPGERHWCVFIAGLRSLGTMAASLCLTSLLRRMRRDEGFDFWSEVDALDVSTARVPVAAMVVRASIVEAAAEADRPRRAGPIVQEGPDPDYRDSFVVTVAEVLDARGDEPRWRAVTLDDFPG
jgi:hypothetical protein